MIRKAAMLAFSCAIIFAVASCSDDESTGPKDQTPPEVSLLEPWDGTTRFGTVDIAISADDAWASVARVEAYVDGDLIGTDDTEPYVIEWNMDAIVDGEVSEVYARAVDVNGNAASTERISVTKGVTEYPTVTITAPSSGGAPIPQGQPVTFTGTANDAEDGAITAGEHFIWSSNLQGELLSEEYTSSTIDYPGLAIGTHVITLTVADSNGMKSTDTVTITIEENNEDYAVVGPGTYEILEPCFDDQRVTITRPIQIMKTEVTVKQAAEALDYLWGTNEDGEHPSIENFHEERNDALEDYYPMVWKFNGSVDEEDPDFDDLTYKEYPAMCITYLEAAMVCNAMSHRDGYELAYQLLDRDGIDLGGQVEYGDRGRPVVDPLRIIDVVYTPGTNGWRLPTEAEWEIAARGGLTGKKFPWGDSGPGALANSLSDPSPPNMINMVNGRGPSPVGSYQPNGYGLYDMVGNVAEMLTDHLTQFLPSEEVENPVNISDAAPGKLRFLVKSGGWNQYGQEQSICQRSLNIPVNTSYKDAFAAAIGFRMVRSLTN